MPVRKEHKEFHKIDTSGGWQTIPGYPAGIQEKILAGGLDEKNHGGSRTRLLRFEPGINLSGKFRSRGRIENPAKRKLNAKSVAEAGDELRAEQGMAAEEKEIVGGADSGNSQQGGKNGRDFFLRGSCGRCAACVSNNVGGAERRQSCPVHFAVEV